MICNIKRRPAGGIKVGTLAVGEIVQIAVSGVMTNFIVANQGIPEDTGTGYDGSYDTSCDGTWMIAEALMDGPKIYSLQTWSYDITSWFSAMIDEKTLNAIRQATYPYYSSSGADTTTTKVTRPSVRELNYLWKYKGSTYDGAPLKYFLTHSAIMPWTGSSSEADYWTRSKSPSDPFENAIYIGDSGTAQQDDGSNARARPLFIFEPDTRVKKVSDGIYQLA